MPSDFKLVTATITPNHVSGGGWQRWTEMKTLMCPGGWTATKSGFAARVVTAGGKIARLHAFPTIDEPLTTAGGRPIGTIIGVAPAEFSKGNPMFIGVKWSGRLYLVCMKLTG